LFEGLFIGGVSAIFEAKYPGIVTQAVCNIRNICGMLRLYKYKKVTEQFKSVVIAATLATLLSYFMGLFYVY
jgi:uncharacterized YccA/Bax inhibitor family protein